MQRPRFLPDNFTLGLITAVLLATLLPCSGSAARLLEWVTDFAIGLLFFLHGAKLSREAVLAGITHWRLHLTVLAATFVLFPLLGVVLKPLLTGLTTPELYLGLLYLCLLPSTVQSSIAFVSVAEGNVPAAVCSATASNLLGIALTPLLVGWLLVSGQVGSSAGSAMTIVYQLLLPFVAGQLLRPWLGRWVDRHKSKLKLVDQGSILLVVYTAFSAAVIGGLWRDTPLPALGGLLLACASLLALVLGLTRLASRKLGFNLADEITIVFCGSKKSLASGVPMAKVLFAGHAIGAIVLPLMLFHQIQLMVCAVLARRYRLRRQAG
ncbi:bile acid:sodium symporter family protein [Vogesella sp. LIG4]|uniref:bile acid:sodium symporter family protein n=1 Tax=Vogesella sp. LIG4 TaxID=1192162 RepID=UPI00081F9446|nr:bile acid:sodium symporter family protein [Vogesella sp. LIG4]SCK12168.1 solute carrier family 10 (sodium/bile acid cotransporter), member 7 [Vogesella sp. LIG4]